MGVDGKVIERLVDFLKRQENKKDIKEKSKDALKQKASLSYSHQQNTTSEPEDGKGVRINKVA